jgi:hypothetical protein
MTKRTAAKRIWSNPTTLDSLIQPDVQRIISRSDRVRAFLVGEMVGSVTDSISVPLYLGGGAGYEARSGSTELSRTQAEKLKTMLLDVHSYQRFAKECIFEPTVGYVFYSGSDSAKAALCFGCFDMIMVSNRGRGWGHFDPIGLDLTHFTADLFPQDTVLKSLVKRHEVYR